jgi:fructosamine-3-kinase
MLMQNIKSKVEEVIDDKIIDHHLVSGGCINDAQIITCRSGTKYFLKTNFSTSNDMFLKEANGLKELAKAKVIRIPEVIFVENDFILLESINSSIKSKNFWEDFGRRFARLHKYTSDNYGFYEDNFVGSTNQLNIADESEKYDWTKFYFNKRLKIQFDLVKKNGYVTAELHNLFGKLEDKIESILSNITNQPCLLHGDLWSGNFMVDETGSACLIDPAVYYGDREADLAMTKLFGGFDTTFYDSYNEEFRLDDSYEYRENIYKLYHVLNHLNLFGTSYYQQALNLIKYYL